MSRKTRWTQNIVRQLFPSFDEWRHQTSIRRAVAAEMIARVFDRAIEYCGGAVVKRMRQDSWRVNELQSILFEWQCRKELRTGGEWVYGGTDVVSEAGESEFS